MPQNQGEERDLVIGCVGNYEWDQVQLWSNSLRLSGYTGRKALIVYNATQAFLNRAAQAGFFLVMFGRDAAGNAVHPRKNPLVVVDRFHDLWALHHHAAFRAQGYGEGRYVITTDVRDIVFQTNPSAWLTANATRPIQVASEAIRFRDEEWGRDNLAASFGTDVFEAMKDNIIYNAGSFAGRWDVLKDLFLQIFLLSRLNPVHNSDQAAFNVLVHSAPYRELVQFNAFADAWCCNIGTTADPSKEHYLPLLVEPGAVYVDPVEGVVKNKQGKTFCLVHQYDRNPALNEMVTRKYR